MSFSRAFANLLELFSGELSSMTNNNVVLFDFADRLCNCSKVSKANGTCTYNGCYRHAGVVYELVCKK